MLSDPIAYNFGAVPAFTGGGVNTFARIGIGRYAGTSGSLYSTDQPARLSITPNSKSGGISTYKTRYEWDKNVSPVNGIQQTDDTLRIDLNISGNLRSFNSTEIEQHLAGLMSTLFTVDPTGTTSRIRRIIGQES